MTQALVHSLNIGTLATWLSLAGFGAVGVAIHPPDPRSTLAPVEALETEIHQEDFLLGSESSTQADSGDSPPPAATPAAAQETLPAPPELPSLTESEPFPEIPELPAPAPTPQQPAASPRESRTAPATRPDSSPRPSQSSSRNSAATGRNTNATGAAGGSGSAQGGQGAGMSNASRLAKGRMPAPSYPSAARRAGQTGTVIVDFTVDANGSVISATASRPSPWPLLNNEAVRTVRRWKFPPGGIMKLQRPIVFQLR